MIKRTLFFGNKASITTRHEQLVIETADRNGSVPTN